MLPDAPVMARQPPLIPANFPPIPFADPAAANGEAVAHALPEANFDPAAPIAAPGPNPAPPPTRPAIANPCNGENIALDLIPPKTATASNVPKPGVFNSPLKAAETAVTPEAIDDNALPIVGNNSKNASLNSDNIDLIAGITSLATILKNDVSTGKFPTMIRLPSSNICMMPLTTWPKASPKSIHASRFFINMSLKLPINPVPPNNSFHAGSSTSINTSAPASNGRKASASLLNQSPTPLKKSPKLFPTSVNFGNSLLINRAIFDAILSNDSAIPGISSFKPNSRNTTRV